MPFASSSFYFLFSQSSIPASVLFALPTKCLQLAPFSWLHPFYDTFLPSKLCILSFRFCCPCYIRFTIQYFTFYRQQLSCPSPLINFLLMSMILLTSQCSFIFLSPPCSYFPLHYHWRAVSLLIFSAIYLNLRYPTQLSK